MTVSMLEATVSQNPVLYCNLSFPHARRPSELRRNSSEIERRVAICVRHPPLEILYTCAQANASSHYLIALEESEWC